MKQDDKMQSNHSDKSQFGWRYALAGLAVVVVSIVMTTVVAMVSLGEAADEASLMEQTQALLPLTGALMFVGGIVTVRLMRGREYRNHDIGLVTPTWWQVALGIGAGLLFWGITWLAAMLSSDQHTSADAVATAQRVGDDIMRDLLLIVAAVVAAPLGEELLFRGMLFRGMYDGMRRRTKAARAGLAFTVAALVSGVIFAVVHGGDGQESQFLLFVLFSMMAAWVYLRTGSLYAPVLMHSVNNALYVLGLALVASTAVSPVVFVMLAVAPLVAVGVLYATQRLLHSNTHAS